MQPNEEIDLRTIFVSIGRGISRIASGFKRLVVFISERKVYFGAWLLLGILAGGVSFYFTRPVYTSSMTLNSYILSNRYCADLLETVDNLAYEKNYEELAKKLNISQAVASNIKDVEFRDFHIDYDDYEMIEDSIKNDVPFKIKVNVYNNSILDSLQIGLVNYFESHPYAIKRKNLKLKNLSELGEKVGVQISQLDTLKKTIEANLGQKGNSQGIVLMQQSIDPLNTYREVIDLYQKQLNMQEEYSLTSSVEILESFTSFKKQSNPKLFKELLKFSFVSCFLGLLIAIRRKKFQS